jgi:UMP kinase
MKVEYVMKMGGSILYETEKTCKLLEILANSRQKNIVYTIGSGYLGEVYKSWSNDSSMPFDISAKCWSNIQSINANIISSLNDKFVVCEDVEEIEQTLKDGKRPIIDARAFHNEFKDSKYQTTDVRSAILCKKLECKNLVIITDVNGIYTEDPKKVNTSKKIERINANELLKLGRTSVDRGLAEKLIEYGIDGYVVGLDTLIQEQEIKGKETLEKGTVIEH